MLTPKVSLWLPIFVLILIQLSCSHAFKQSVDDDEYSNRTLASPKTRQHQQPKEGIKLDRRKGAGQQKMATLIGRNHTEDSAQQQNGTIVGDGTESANAKMPTEQHQKRGAKATNLSRVAVGSPSSSIGLAVVAFVEDTAPPELPVDPEISAENGRAHLSERFLRRLSAQQVASQRAKLHRGGNLLAGRPVNFEEALSVTVPYGEEEEQPNS